MNSRPLSSFVIRHSSFLLALLLASCTSEKPAPPLANGGNITPPVSFTQAVGSLPVNLALTPDHKYAVSTDAGYRQSLHLLRLSDGRSVAHLDYSNKTPPGSGDLIPKTNGLYYGLAIADDNTLYAAQGALDSIAVIQIKESKTTAILDPKDFIATTPGDFPSGLAVDKARFLYVANQSVAGKNDTPFDRPGSVAIYNTATHAEVGRYTFKDSYFGTSNFPLAIAVKPDGSKLYVASERDAAVYVLNTSDPTAPRLIKKIPTGAHPSCLLFTSTHERLFVANADSDTVSIINTDTDTVTDTIALRPDVARDLPGATPLGLALSPENSTLYVALADMNAIAIVDLPHRTVTGYLPTGWYPTAVAVRRFRTDDYLLVLNAKGAAARIPNLPPHRQSPNNLLEGNAQILEIPTPLDFPGATAQVLKNNHYDRLARPVPEPLASITKKSGNITHVIYIIKENRTYDQILGDIPGANGDPKLCLFPNDVTPNQHSLAKRFGILDNLYACGEVSGDGWNWSTESMANPYVVRNVPYNYSRRGRKFDFEGQNNDYPTGGIPAIGPDGKPIHIDAGGNEEGDLLDRPNATTAPATAPATTRPMWQTLPPPGDPAAGFPAIPDVAQAPGGHIWDLCLAHAVTFRNYGMFVGGPQSYPTVTGLQPADHNLAGVTDIDYRQFDLDYPDSDAPALLAAQSGDPAYLLPKTSYGKFISGSRATEFRREFNLMLEKDPTGNSVPSLLLVRLPNDHTSGTRGGRHSPTSQVADNDYAVGQLVDAISHSPIWPHTAIFIIEDDAQDGSDHVDCHRTTGYVISPYLAKGQIHHQFYNTNSMLRTIEVLLDLPPMTQHDATATLIGNWTTSPSNIEPYTATMPDAKYFIQHNPSRRSGFNSTASAESLRLIDAADKMDFTREDAAPAQLLNEMIWKSVKGDASEMPPPKTTHFFPASKTKDKDDD